MFQPKTYIYGKHALIEALTHKPKSVRQIYFAETMDDAKLRALAKKAGTQVSPMTAKIISEVGIDSVHQGVIALLSLADLMIPYKTFLQNIQKNISENTALVLFDEIQDPQNVGAVIRSAAAFGVSGILIPEYNQAQVTGAVIKVSAGMAFRVPLVSIGNENVVIRDLKKNGFWVYGLAGEGKSNVSTEKFDAPTLFVLGNEATGIREKTRELCDVLLSIPMNPKCESLNAATSMSVALYAWSAQHPDALK